MMGFIMTLLSSSMSCTLAIFSPLCTLLAPVPSKAANYKPNIRTSSFPISL